MSDIMGAAAASDSVVTRADFDSLEAQMVLMMQQMKTTMIDSKLFLVVHLAPHLLIWLTIWVRVTFPIRMLQRRRRRMERPIHLKRMVLPMVTHWYHHHRSIHREDTFLCHTLLTLDHYLHLMLLVLPIGNPT
jgi:hypothetical protein